MIKEYIEFAIDNGYKLIYFPYEKWHLENYPLITLYVHSDEGFSAPDMIDITKIITSKDFISAVARGIEKQSDKEGFLSIDWGNTSCTYGLYEENYGPKDRIEIELISDVTHYQAISIRDNTLDTFIKSLLDNK